MGFRTLGIYSLLIGQFLFISGTSAPENVIFHFHLLRGEWLEDRARPNEISILSSATDSKIAMLATKLDSPQAELTAETIDCLMDIFDLKTVDDFFAYSVEWEGRTGTYSRNIDQLSYHFKFVSTPVRLSPERIGLGFALYYSEEDPVQFANREKKKKEKAGKYEKTEIHMDKILDTKFLLDIDSPVIACIPSGKETLFLLIYARRKGEKPKIDLKTPIVPPKEFEMVIPAYPEELRRQGVHGQVELQVTIDEKGAVAEVKVATPLHPYLDFAAVQAIRLSTFKPAVQDGKPIAASVKITVNFDPNTYRILEEKAMSRAEPSVAGAAYAGKTLIEILAGSAEYCDKLVRSALDFICEERIKEIHYNFETDPKWILILASSKRTGQITKSFWLPQWDPKRTQKNDFLCDFLYIRKGEKAEERRIVLRENGQKMPDRNKLLKEKRFTALDPVLAAAQILSRDRQPSYYFRLNGTESIGGRNSFVLQAVPKMGNTWGVENARIWIDQSDYKVLRIEIQGVPVEGYEDVLKDAVQFRVRPYLLTTHIYEIEKKGVRFPARSTIRVEYPKRGDFNKDRTLKLKIDMTYDKYKFFFVEIEESIKK